MLGEVIALAVQGICDKKARSGLASQGTLEYGV